jgi:hypothetical protein
MIKIYAGIGARKTPNHILRDMTFISKKLDNEGYILRTGGALGADNAFLKGSTNSEVFLPWKYYNGEVSSNISPSEEAFAIAEKFHPAWYNCTSSTRSLHARNAHIILGNELNDPVNFVICYTPRGELIGGTALGIRIAEHYKIPIFNLGNQSMDQINVIFNR